MMTGSEFSPYRIVNGSQAFGPGGKKTNERVKGSMNMERLSVVSGKTKTSTILPLMVVSCAMLLAALLFSWMFHAYVLEKAEENVTNLLLSHKGIHHYVQQVLIPFYAKYQSEGEIAETFYAPELLSSSFIVRRQHLFYNKERTNEGLPELYYKLAAIIGYAEIVQEELPEGTEVWQNQQAVIDAGLRAKDLVKQILVFARQGEHENQPVQMHLILKEALKLVRSSIPTTIDIRQKIEATTGVVFADPTQIHQVIMNLCTNAYHAMLPSGGVLGVSLTSVEIGAGDEKAESLVLSPGPYLRLEVSDTGCGMERKTMDRIFEPYFTTKEKGKGTGLGLAMVHGIVNRYGGTVLVYSEFGVGTSFNVYLPHVLLNPASSSTSVKRTLPRGNERILVVDDEESVCRMAARMLESLGYQVTAFTQSTEAWEQLLARPDAFDLVITDMTMPAMTGVELAQRYLSIRSDALVILCTGFSELITEEKAKAVGIRTFLMKPIIKKDMAMAVRTVLDEKKR